MNTASSILFRRLPYSLSPQIDIYEHLGPFVKDKRVLEVGFGTGIGVLQYAHHAEFVDAIEVDDAAVRFARRVLPLPNVIWEHTSAESIHMQDAYEFVVMIEVLEHILDFDLALRAVIKALEPGGQVLITVPNARRYRRTDTEGIFQEWDASGLHTMLSEVFDIVTFLDFELQELPGIPMTNMTPLITLCS